ncbi:nucleotidyl transferase AbiEii/AbiGii toxin family protein [Brevibacterium zhoupengii]|uniref:nucleotidyl transferase AbiEii/AbiGii toxin family protein n=1 Tax=Brevibacterium zhoupengii TaxID=2898795 RepID=UPI001E3A2646|nr:nucleotidyl transferase AbiEii/AbiGii toxin family protein [Brevibacterium zhoupengii]
MSNDHSYPNWKALNTALSSSAKAQSQVTGQDQSDLMKMVYLDRFLCRVFTNPDRTDWVLKGGTGMLSRVPDTRTTKDIDVATSVGDVDEAVKALTALVSRDIGDHVTFRLESSTDTIDGTLHPGVTGRRLFYRMHEAQTQKPLIRIPVDMTVEPAPIGGIEVFNPRNRILPKRGLPTSPYRLYPVSDQIADKVTATMQSYGPDRYSTRVKDLLDLVVIARTQTVSIGKLRTALNAQHHYRDERTTFTPPKQWRADYTQEARQIPAIGAFHDFDGATALVRKLVDPALQANGHTDLTWKPETGWTAGSPTIHQPVHETGTITLQPTREEPSTGALEVN